MERLTIVGVVHGQRSCIEETRRIIEEMRPDVVAIELPPPGIQGGTFKFLDVRDVDAEMEEITTKYHEFFNLLKKVGFPKGAAGKMEDVALGLAMQGLEFASAIEVANEIGATIEFIDMSRDAIFWEFLKQTIDNIANNEISRANPNHFPAFDFSFLKKIPALISTAISEWTQTFDILVKIYREKDYHALMKTILPMMKNVEDNPILGDVLVNHRNKFMAERLVELLEEHSGRIIVITGFGHVEGLREIIEEKLSPAS